MLYPQNGDRVVTIVYVTSLHSMTDAETQTGDRSQVARIFFLSIWPGLKRTESTMKFWTRFFESTRTRDGLSSKLIMSYLTQNLPAGMKFSTMCDFPAAGACRYVTTKLVLKYYVKRKVANGSRNIKIMTCTVMTNADALRTWRVKNKIKIVVNNKLL